MAKNDKDKGSTFTRRAMLSFNRTEEVCVTAVRTFSRRDREHVHERQRVHTKGNFRAVRECARLSRLLVPGSYIILLRYVSGLITGRVFQRNNFRPRITRGVARKIGGLLSRTGRIIVIAGRVFSSKVLCRRRSRRCGGRLKRVGRGLTRITRRIIRIMCKVPM